MWCHSLQHSGPAHCQKMITFDVIQLGQGHDIGTYKKGRGKLEVGFKSVQNKTIEDVMQTKPMWSDGYPEPYTVPFIIMYS